MKTILVVDDDEAIRTLLQEELEDEGVELQRQRPTFLQVSVEEEPWYEILVFRRQ